MWAPDAYEGAPTPVTGFMAAGVKAAAFAAIVRVLGDAFGEPGAGRSLTGWASILSVLAALTMTVGNLAAIRQENVKRMLAYSSIAHAGYLLIGVVRARAWASPSAQAGGAVLPGRLHLHDAGRVRASWPGSATARTSGCFVDDWAGVGAARPGVALAMTIFLLSLGGVPPTGGFFGKFYLFRRRWSRPQLYWLVIVGVLNSVDQHLLLPAHRRRDVLPRRRSRPLAPTDGASMRVCAVPDGGRRRAAGRLPEHLRRLGRAPPPLPPSPPRPSSRSGAARA